MMTELGPCIGKCSIRERCFFVKDYFACRHLMCYSLAVKLKRCVRCGEERLACPMRTDNDDEVETRRNILRTELCCLRR